LLKVPLFPGYIFVHADLRTSAYYDVIKSRGVVRVLGRIGECTPIPEETIRSIQKVMESGRSFDPYANLQNGMQVRVVEGLLTGAIGSILRKKPGKRRLVVSVELLGRALAVDLAEEAVEVC
jgi:transcription antitermination factor NusG